MSSTGPNHARKLHLVGLVQALVPCYRLILVYEYLLNCLVKNSFFTWNHRNSYSQKLVPCGNLCIQ
eukprot:2655933-Ditylum_brightwellii.AAC.1